ncbi:MAG: hypothetical protein GAK45_01625 [Pseudomonas citronellolis]|nr:MAG: hypothetical protein GAK45_01625 [Pseudomonas citronellolis]
MRSHDPLLGTLLRLVQLAVASALFLLFSAYVWLVQLNLEQLDNSGASGYWKALLFALVIFGGGFAYDCAKAIALLPRPAFERFIEALFESLVHLLGILLAIIGSAALAIQYPQYPWLGNMVGGLALLGVLLFSRSLLRTVASATAGT